MRKFLMSIFLISCIPLIMAVDQPPANTIANIKNNLKLTLPDLTVDQITNTPIAGIYEVVSGRKVFYVDSSGRYAFLGNLVDLTTKQSLTEQKVKQLSVVDWNQLPLNIALRQVIGKGEHKIAIFTDPDCPFCQRLEGDTVPKLKNVTIYYFLFPLSIHANAENDAKKILCSETPTHTFVTWMQGNLTSLPVNTSCNNASKLAIMKEVGNKVVQVEATPTIVLPDGNIIAGLVPADYLNQLIIETSAKTTASAPIMSVKK